MVEYAKCSVCGKFFVDEEYKIKCKYYSHLLLRHSDEPLVHKLMDEIDKIVVSESKSK